MGVHSHSVYTDAQVNNTIVAALFFSSTPLPAAHAIGISVRNVAKHPLPRPIVKSVQVSFPILLLSYVYT